jgi:glycine betaine/choline ABC-type transport system substrate-binding protein
MINSYARRLVAGTVVMSALGFAACSSDSKNEVSPVNQTVTVIGTNAPASQLLTELYAESLERGGFRVARRAPVADLAAGYAALNSGVADLFVTYTGELVEFLATEEPELAASTSTTEAPTTTSTTIVESSTTEATGGDTTGADSTTTTATDEGATTTTTIAATTTAVVTDGSSDVPTDESSTSVDESSTTTTISIVGQSSSLSINLQAQQIGEILPAALQTGAASFAEDKPVIACASSVATAGALSTLTDIAGQADDLSLAATADWATADPFGAAGFEKVYDATFGTVDTLVADKLGASITPPVPEVDETSTTVVDESTTTTVPAPVITDDDCAAFASSLDSSIPSDALVMDDDQDWIRTNAVIPLMTETKFSIASPSVDQVSQLLNTSDLRSMLAAVEKGAAVPTVVDTFLTRNSVGS